MNAERKQVLRMIVMVTGWCEQAIRELEKAEPRPESLIAQLRRTRDEAMDAATAFEFEAHVA
jgi:hypothetical protein